MDDIVIETRSLTKRYGAFTAVDGLDLIVRQGEVFGVLGPNGSGKTTTILMLLGLTEPTAGSVSVLGFDPVRQPLEVKARVGYMPDRVGFYDSLTARENLNYIGKLNGLRGGDLQRRIADVLERVGLRDVAAKRVGAFSHGMRQRLGVAEVLLKEPQLVIMDEPTQGLDPEGAREFLDLIRSLKQRGITVALSSHLLHQVQATCDRVGLFHRGRMVLEGTVEDLAQNVLGGAFRIRLAVRQPLDGLEQVLQGLPGVTAVQQPSPGHYLVDAASDLRSAAARAALEAGGELLALDVEHPDLDEVYARYFKEVQHARAA